MVFTKNLTFKIVDFNQLIKKKYYILIKCELQTIERTGNFVKYVEHDIAFFTNMYYNSSPFYSIYLNKDDTFYDIIFQKEKIQNAMELRAINKILQRLIGDETFKYE